MMKLKSLLIILATVVTANVAAQTLKPIKYGDFEHWAVRYIHESKLLGGKTKTLYVIAPADTIDGNVPYHYGAHSPWCNSNAYANVIGIAKGSATTFPEKRGNGTCARLDVYLETVKVAGMVDISVAIAGSMFLGKTFEPVRSANSPYKNIDMGIPFTDKPTALVFDYKCNMSSAHTLTKALGVRVTTIQGHDEADVYIYLQKRWEDADGNVYAKRIGTARQRFSHTVAEWQNGYRMPILYGNISGRSDFKPYQNIGLPFNCRNSKGKMVPIQEIGWGDADDTPTHLVLMFSSGCYPAFYGHLGNSLWVDNVRLEYK